jgi:hypothetical protein
MRTAPDIVRCSEPGCTEEGRLEHRSQRDLRRNPRPPWRCTKHSAGKEWMTPANHIRRQRLVAKKLPGCGDHLFWCPDDSSHGSGYAYGPGFSADTSEFPEGTVLVVTAHAIPPGDA